MTKKQIAATSLSVLFLLVHGTACTRYWEKGGDGSALTGKSSAITVGDGGNGGNGGGGTGAGGSFMLLSVSPANGSSGVSLTTGIQLVFNQAVTGLIDPATLVQPASGACDFSKGLEIREASANALTCVGVPAAKVHVTGATVSIDDTALKACTQYLIYLSKAAIPQLDTDKAAVFSTGGCMNPVPMPTANPTGVPTPAATPACTYESLHALKQVEVISASAPLGSVSRVVDTFPRAGQTQIFFGAKSGLRPFPLDYSQDVFFQIQFSDNVGPVSLPIQVNARAIAEIPRKVPFPSAPTYSDPDYQAMDAYDHSYAYAKYAACDPAALIHLYKSTDPSRCIGVNRTGFAPYHTAWTSGKTLSFDVPYLEPSTFYTLKIRKAGGNGPVPLQGDTTVTFQTAPLNDAALRPVAEIPIVIPSPDDVDGAGKVFSSYPQRALYFPQDQVAFKNLMFFANFTGLLSPTNVVQPTDGACLPGYQITVYEEGTGRCLGGQNPSLFTAQVGSAIFPKKFTQLRFLIPNLLPRTNYTANLNGSIIKFRTAPKVCGSPDDGSGLGSAVFTPAATPVPTPTPTPKPPGLVVPIPQYTAIGPVPFGAPVIVNPKLVIPKVYSIPALQIYK